jgi:hypothetical protein
MAFYQPQIFINLKLNAMNKIKFFTMLAALMTLTMASTCHSDDDNWTNSSQAQNALVASVSNTAQQGNWHITYFYDTDHEETANFTSYTFTFGPNGVLTATNADNTYNGAWSVTNGESGNDDSGHHSSSDIDFNISFSSPPNFAELTEDWHIVTYTSGKIELIHVSGGNGGTDHLIFEKN